MLLTILGGVGLFLLGISLLTDGLRAVSGDRMRRVLGRVAGSRPAAFASGAAVTAVIQSSNASLLMTMGFAGAGLLGLTEALAVVAGTGVGTTSTAWLVATLGLRFAIGDWALALLVVAVLVRLVAPGRLGAGGTAGAGLALLLLGIAFMQEGLAGYQDAIGETLPAGTGAAGVLTLVLLGLLTTVATQSSSVAIAGTLTAATAGAVDLRQGSALLLGQHLGVAVTALVGMAAAGTAGRRVGIGYILLAAGSTAVGLLVRGPLTLAAEGLTGGDPAITLAAFYTGFTAITAVLFLAALPTMERLTVRILPLRGPVLPALDARSAATPGAAPAALAGTVAALTTICLSVVRSRMDHGQLSRQASHRLDEVDAGVGRLRAFLATVPPAAYRDAGLGQAVRAVERLEALANACRAAHLRGSAFRGTRVVPCTTRLRDAMAAADAWLAASPMPEAGPLLAELRAVMAVSEAKRADVVEATAVGQAALPEALGELEALHWMREQARQLERIVAHLAPAGAPDVASVPQGTPGEGAGVPGPTPTGPDAAPPNPP